MSSYPIPSRYEHWKRTLCVSQLIAVTPSTLKSNGSTGKPAGSRKGIMKLPRQQSTCRPTLYFFANLPKATISSWQPSGKLIADPTSYSCAVVSALAGMKDETGADHDRVAIT